MSSKSKESVCKTRKSKKATEETQPVIIPEVSKEEVPEHPDLKKIVGDRVAYLNNEIANGHATVNENERQLLELREQVCRLEGAKYFAQQLLAKLYPPDKK